MRSNSIPKIWRKSRVVALLKPCKDPASPTSYRPISLLCHTYKLFERLILNRVAPFVDEHLIPEQACFRPGKSCTSQLLKLTQLIEYGYEEGIITGAAFVDLSAAYHTGNHIILTRKLFEITQDVRLTELIQNMLSNRRVYVDLVGKRSRWRRQKMTFHKAASLALCCSTYIQMISLFIPTQGVSCTPMICALPHRSNHLRRWKRLLVMHSQA